MCMCKRKVREIKRDRVDRLYFITYMYVHPPMHDQLITSFYKIMIIMLLFFLAQKMFLPLDLV